MSRVVWKFVMDAPTVAFDVRAPKLVLVGMDPASSLVAVWMEVTPPGETDLVNVRGEGTVLFAAVPTGGTVTPGWHHQGSVITPGGLVWHVYADRDLS
jgi:hypothetical protein